MTIPTDSVNITVLMENTTTRTDLRTEHGLSFLLTVSHRRVLFDTGQSDQLLANARTLGLDISTIDTLVISHGHYDHGGGVAAVIAAATGPIETFLHPQALLPKFALDPDGKVREIGIQQHSLAALQSPKVRLHLTTKPVTIAPGIILSGEIPRIHRQEEDDEGFRLDPLGESFDPLIDDQALAIVTPAGIITLLGCAHSGVINTLDHLAGLVSGTPFRAIMGGMHLRHASRERIEWTIAQFARFSPAHLGPAHCTGSQPSALIGAAFPAQVFPCRTGTSLHFSAQDCLITT
jgi:7,8-dihydropterin-6-yl-methyl-4-(beta-D-ribofuranosyl)aminobenzene 5'-phosphate synthase